MSEIKRIGIDTSKAVFTLHAINQADQPVLRVNLRRAQMIPFCNCPGGRDQSAA
jgi:transposase